MNKETINILKGMYNTTTLDNIPMQVLDALHDVNELCKKVNGSLISRQVIASIVHREDRLKCYDKESDYYIGV